MNNVDIIQRANLRGDKENISVIYPQMQFC